MKLVKPLLFLLILIFSISASEQVSPLIQNDWTTFTWPYNAYLPEKSDGGVNGHVGNACGYNSIARILHYYGYPVNGTEVIDFTDYFGIDWYCDLTSLDLNYTAMPYKLDWNSPESEYCEVAKLYLAASAVGEKIGIGYSDALTKVSDAMVQYFNFKPSAELLNRREFTKEEWVEIFKTELDNSRPILVVGRTPESSAPWKEGGWEGHWWICDGYNSNDEFYVNYSFGGELKDIMILTVLVEFILPIIQL